MESKEFINIRKKLHKTQKETASLLGISLKAVCSYEQGWRTIPNHVERQLFFLYVRKSGRGKNINKCWEIKKCPDDKKKQCPAWEFDSGEFCWFINGTICDNIPHRTWSSKFAICRKCEVMKSIR